MADSSAQSKATIQGARVGFASLSRGIPAAIALLVGAALLGAGIAQTVGGALQARARGALDAIVWDRHTVSADEIAPEVADLERADAWWYDPENAFTIGIVDTELASQSAAAASDHGVLVAAQNAFRQSLAQGPINAAGWTWLAYARLLDHSPPQAVVDALSTSIEFGRVEPTLWSLRCRIGLALYDSLDPAHRAMLADQIRLLGRQSPDELARIGRASGKLGIVIEALLAGDNKTMARFQNSLRYVK